MNDEHYYWLCGQQVSEACAKRWAEAGWIELAGYGYHEDGDRAIHDHFYEAVAQ